MADSLDRRVSLIKNKRTGEYFSPFKISILIALLGLRVEFHLTQTNRNRISPDGVDPSHRRSQNLRGLFPYALRFRNQLVIRCVRLKRSTGFKKLLDSKVFEKFFFLLRRRSVKKIVHDRPRYLQVRCWFRRYGNEEEHYTATATPRIDRRIATQNISQPVQ